MANEFVVKNGIKIPTETASTVPYLDANKKLVSSAVTPTQLSYLDATSSIQTQLDTKAATSGKLSQFATTSSSELAGIISDETGSGALVFGTSPTLTTPDIGAATATSVNGTSIPNSKTLVVTTDKLSALAATTSAELAGVISDETGSGSLVFGTSPTLTTPTIDIITLDGQASTPSNPSAGNYRVYVKDSTQKLTVLNSTGTETTVGTGSVSINYISNYDAESDTSGWSTFADAASTSLADGTGGSPNSTWTRTTSSPFRGTASFLFTKTTGASRQGEGVSYDFTIDSADTYKVLQGSFEYNVASGTYVDEDMSVWIYDITNASMIQPAPYKLQKVSTIATRFNFEFQTSSSTSYRFIIYVNSSTESSCTLKFDNFNIGPQAKLYGSPVTDWNTSWTPTGTLSSNVTYYGKWRRVGDSMQIEGMISFSGDNTEGVDNITLPNGANLDTNKFSPVATGRAVFGSARIYDSSTDQSYDAVVIYDTATSIRFSRGDTTAGSATDTSSNRPITFASGDIIAFNAIVPILGWSSSTVMSHDASTRVVAAIITGDPASASSGNPIIVPTVSYDSHGCYSNITGRYTVAVPGLYKMFGALQSASAATTLTIYKNAVSNQLCGNLDSNGEATFIGMVNCVAGDIIDIRPGGTVDATSMSLNIERISGPAQIAASESVIASYFLTSNLTINTSVTDIAGLSKYVDSHNAMNTTTGVYTFPISGTYELAATLRFDTGGSAATQHIITTAGSVVSTLVAASDLAASKAYSYCPTLTFRVLAGNSIKLQGQSLTNSSTAIGSQNFISIKRVGNY